MDGIPQHAKLKLESQRNIWLATTRPNNRPHLVPVWFAWYHGKIYVCVEPGSVKARNIERLAEVVLALEEGVHPVICEGKAAAVPPPWPEALSVIFKQKYDWEISIDTQYTRLLEITPQKWLVW